MAKRKIKPHGYWKNPQTIRKELLGVMKEQDLTTAPTAIQLATLGHSSLAIAIRKYYPGKYVGLRKDLGEEQKARPAGYWQEWDNFEREMQEVIDELGYFPSTHELNQSGRGSLAFAMKYHGKIDEIRARMGCEKKDRPDGHWKNFDNVKRELERISYSLGKFPNRSDLRRLKRFDLSSAIDTYHDGINGVRQRLGEDPVRKPKGYWNSTENVQKELEGVIDELDHFPTHEELKSLRRNGLSNAIVKHGGITVFAQRMGHDPNKKPTGYWKNPDNVVSEVQKMLRETGLTIMPSGHVLEETGYKGLAAGIESHFGYGKVRQLVAENDDNPNQLESLLRLYAGGNTRMASKETPDGYWKDWDNVQDAIQMLIVETGKFPTRDVIKERVSGLSRAIDRHYGGLGAVREKMGYDSATKPRNYWRDWENVQRELQEVIDDLGYLPSQRELSKIKRSSLNRAIIKYHGGMRTVRKRLGEEVLSVKPNGHWKDWNNVKRELQETTAELGHFPSVSELRNTKRSSLYESIKKHHGGMHIVRERIGNGTLIKPKGHWKDWDNVRKELEMIIDELGHFPGSSELVETKRSGLYTAIGKYHGGMQLVRERMGYSEGRTNPEELETLLVSYTGGSENG